jgi:DNA sulfur modification protein DndD
VIEIQLKYVELYNWTSYWNAPLGEEGSQAHVFSFLSDSGRNGYVIFGENSRGKSSFTDAIQWLLFGKAWTKPVSVDGKFLKRVSRPLVGHPKDQVDPLLNTTSYLNNNFNFYVRATIEHEDETYQISRIATPKKEGKIVVNDSEMDVGLTVNNLNTKVILESNEAQDFIESEILPENLSRFFFIDGESITEYRALIASRDENVELRRNIEDILNFPVLKKGISDFAAVKNNILDDVARTTKITRKNRKLKKANLDLDEKIMAQGKLKDRGESDTEKTLIKLEEFENIMDTFSGPEQLLADKRIRVERKNQYEESLVKSYNERRRDNQDLWLHILKPSIEDAIHNLEPEISEKNVLKDNLSVLMSRIRHLSNLSEETPHPCPTCSQFPPSRSNEEKKQDKVELDQLQDEEKKIKKDIKNRNVTERKLTLERFNIHSRMGVIGGCNNRINILKGQIETNLDELNEIENSLDNIDEEQITSVRGKSRKYGLILAEHQSKVRRASNEIDRLVSERAKNNRELIGDDGSKHFALLESKTKIIDWLEHIWVSSLDVFSQQSRIEVELLASNTFKKLTNNPEGFSRLILNENFGLIILDAEDLPVQTPTPGMMQVAAISLIDALGSMSDIEFPILFDTPGQSIDQTHRNNIIQHYWSERSTQFVIIPSSGEFRIDEVEKEYDHLLARTWELQFSDKQNKTTVKNRVMN